MTIINGTNIRCSAVINSADRPTNKLNVFIKIGTKQMELQTEGAWFFYWQLSGSLATRPISLQKCHFSSISVVGRLVRTLNGHVDILCLFR